MKITAHSAFDQSILQCGFEFGVLDASYDVTPEQLAHLQAYPGVVVVSVEEDAPAVAVPSKKSKASE